MIRLKNYELKFMDEKCIVQLGKYATTGNTSITMFVRKTMEPMAVCTVNGTKEYEKDVVVVKDYRENEGVLSALIRAGIVEEPHTMEIVGVDSFGDVCKLITWEDEKE